MNKSPENPSKEDKSNSNIQNLNSFTNSFIDWLPCWYYHINESFIEFNSVALELLDIQSKEHRVDFDTFIQVIHPDDSVDTLKHLENCIHGSCSEFKEEFRIKTSSGKIRWILQQGRVIEKKDHKAHIMTGIFSDMTEQKHSLHEITKSEAQNKAFLKLIPDNIFIINRKGVIVDAFVHSKNIVDFDKDDLIDKSLKSLFNYSSDYEIDVIIEQAFISKKVQVVEFTSSVNSMLFYEVRFVYIDSKTILLIVRDITSRKADEEALIKSEAELKKLNETKDKLFSIIGHDLKSPLNNILGFADMLNENIESLTKEKIREYISYINISSSQAFALFENLLEWSRAQSNKIVSYPTNFDFTKIAEKNIELLQTQRQLKNISIINNLKEGLIIYADPNMISTVFRNLLSNAVKFSKTSGDIEINFKNNDNNIIISIRDSGIGMSVVISEKLFKINENITRKGTSGEKGTGLGLLLCKEFMEKNKASLYFETTENIGTTFFMALPKK